MSPPSSDRYFDEIVLEHLKTQAELLRENGYNNRQVSEILHISRSAITKLLGKMSPELRASHASAARHKPPTAEQAAQRLERRQQLTKEHSRKAAEQLKDDAELGRTLGHIFRVVNNFEPQGVSTESIIHSSSDLVSAVRSENEHADVRLCGSSVSVRPLDSDDVVWRDEAEPQWPHQPSAHYYALYSAWDRKQRAIERIEAASRGTSVERQRRKFNRMSHGYFGPPDFDVDRQSRGR